MNEEQNLKTIQDIYAAFGRGDVAFIVNQMADDIRWVTQMDSMLIRFVAKPSACNGEVRFGVPRLRGSDRLKAELRTLLAANRISTDRFHCSVGWRFLG